MRYSDIFSLVASDLEEVEQELDRNIQSPIPLVYEISKYLLKSGGKRIRPSILLLASGACGLLNGKERIYAAASLELIHTASLLHDDVVDDATLRRGKPSSNVVWGNKPTVLVGDFLLARALGLIQLCGNLDLIKAVTDASAKLAEGQVLEVMSGEQMANMTEDIYFSIIEYKTASLLESCGKIGALLAKNNNGYVEALSKYGLNIGIAFQLIDDSLDYTSTPNEIGKQVGQDLLEGKMTLPLIHTLLNLPPKLRNECIEKINNEKLSESDVKKIVKMVDEFGGITYTQKMAKLYAAKAKDTIKPLPENPYKESLYLLADYVVERSY